MTGTVLSTSKALSHLILTTAKYSQCPLQRSEKQILENIMKLPTDTVNNR